MRVGVRVRVPIAPNTHWLRLGQLVWLLVVGVVGMGVIGVWVWLRVRVRVPIASNVCGSEA